MDFTDKHNFGEDSMQACSCGYVPFTIATQAAVESYCVSYGYGEAEAPSFSAEATLAEETQNKPTYQWYENDKKIENATEATYEFPIGKEPGTYEYYCEVSCNGYTQISPTITVEVAKIQGKIQIAEGKDKITRKYQDSPFYLDGISKTGDGTLCYTVTSGGAVISGGAVVSGSGVIAVSEDGKVQIVSPGIAVIKVQLSETDNYKSAEEYIYVTIEKADMPEVLPEATVEVKNTVKNVSDVPLIANWKWSAEDAERTIKEGESVKVTAEYIGEDSAYYNCTTQTVTITRQSCTASDILFNGEGEKAPTCTEKGHGHKECTICGDVLESNIEVEMAAHILKKVEKVEATTETEGCEGYWECTICGTKFFDEKGTKKVENKADLIIPKKESETDKGNTGNETDKDSTGTGGNETDKDSTGTGENGTDKDNTKADGSYEIGQVFTDKKSAGVYKVLSLDGTKGTVVYVKPSNAKATNITVPATVKIGDVTYKVTAIEKNAFKNNKYLKKVTIGSNVTTIGTKAFYNCKNLKTVKFGKNVTTIKDKAFYKCAKITSITIPSKVKKIGKASFKNCTKLKKITIKTTKLTKKKIGSNAFKGIHKKATFKVPKSKYKAYKNIFTSKVGFAEKTMNVKKS